MANSVTLAFDVYGTLFNDISICHALEKLFGDHARKFTNSCREKQI